MESWKCGGCGKWIAPSVTFCDCQTESVVDLRSVKIGNQIWSQTNFDGTELKDGSTIPIIECSKCWSEMKTPAMCYYDNDKSKGTLYNWYAVKELKVPSGWRVPSDDDWNKLDKLKVKEINLSLTRDGCRNYYGTFNNIRFNGHWWSVTENLVHYAWDRSLTACNEYIYRDYNTKNYGLSLRLVRDL